MFYKRWLRSPRRVPLSPVFVTLLGCVVSLQFLLFTQQTCNFVQVTENKTEVVVREQKQVKEETIHAQRETCHCGYYWRPSREDALVYPAPERAQAYLTIGIPTVKRQGDTYIIRTLQSLLDSMSEDHKREVIIVVFVADLDNETRTLLAEDIHKQFTHEIEDGLIHVIKAPLGFYPVIHTNKHTYGQGDNYIKWRAKQNFDSSYLFKYSVDLATYYMALEDDVTTVKGFVNAVKTFVDEQKTPWTSLEFSELGFIGKLYHNSDLIRLAMLFEIFYQEQPVDYTYLYFNMLNTQIGQRLRKPTLFQHQGLKSSYPGKLQQLKDRFFDNMAKVHKGDNPPAEIITSMEVYNTFVPKMAYSSSEGYFWSHGNPREGDHFTVIFDEPQKLSRVVIISGSESHPNDRFFDARVDAQLTLLKSQGKLECTNDVQVGNFTEGRVDVSGLDQQIQFKVMCLRVTVLKPHNAWVIIREIAVFTVQ